MMNSPASVPITMAMPIASGAEAFGSMAALVGLVVAGAALVCAAGTGILMLFPRIIVRAPAPQVDLETAEVLPAVQGAADDLRRRARPVLRAALIWASGGALLAVIGAIVHDPTMIYPALSMLIAVGILLVIVATGFRLAGNRTHNGIPLKNLIVTGAITAIVSTVALVLLSLIFTSPAAATPPAAAAVVTLEVIS